MYRVISKIEVIPDGKEKFLDEMIEDATQSLQKEETCLNFDVYVDIKNPNRFCLYEIYKDKEAFESHKKTEHFLKWSTNVKDLILGDPDTTYL